MKVLWDPIASTANSQEDVLRSAKRREIQNILKSYVGYYDPFCELLQNALDAVDERRRELKEPEYCAQIWIEVNLKTNSFSVTDNGIGFREDEFKTFLAPSVTYKEGRKSRGKKGVGATYLAYGFDFLQAGTATPEFKAVTQIIEARKWIEDKKGTTSRPQVTESTLIHSAFSSVDRGSTFTIRFGSTHARPRELDWVGATNAIQWRIILLAKTPLGQVFQQGKAANTKFHLTVLDKSGKSTNLIDQDSAYALPHKVISAAANLRDIQFEQQQRIKKNLDPSRLPQKYYHLNAVYREWSTAELSELLSAQIDAAAQSLLTEFQIKAYGFFCYTVKIWDQFNDQSMRLRKGLRIVRGGLQLATDNMPQGELMAIPLTSSIGYQNQMHIVVHFEDADPDLGRKGFQPELVELAADVAVSCAGLLKKWRHHLKSDTGVAPSIASETELSNWIQEQLEHEKIHPITISNKHFFLPLHELSITSEPKCEQDVIVLFNQLIAGGVIRGIRLLAASQTKRYDAVYRFHMQEPAHNHTFHIETNPLGVESSQFQALVSNARVLEYKFDLDALIRDFDNEEKQERDIDLVVVWHIGLEWRTRYSVVSLLDMENLHSRPCHGITHEIRDQHSGDRRFFAIILSELLAFLNDPAGVQEFHMKAYGDS